MLETSLLLCSRKKGENKWEQRDIETAVFFDDDRRYADLLNGYIFDGKQVVTEKQFYSRIQER